MRLIDADDVLERAEAKENWIYDLTDLPDFLAGCPTVDVAPVIHARWEVTAIRDGETVCICTHCKCKAQFSFYDRIPYCWNCGAKMDLEE